MITREGSKELATQVELDQKLQNAMAAKKQADEDADRRVAEIEAKWNEAVTIGSQRVTTAAVFGFGVGGGLAFFAHDFIADYFGRGTAYALLALPVTGAAMLAITPGVFADRPGKKHAGENKETRAASYGAGAGLLLVGGYCSYLDYAANP